ncbi:MAG: hypothetical protein NZT92_07230 [Abditibacteriales bacterium]|nr:hypothetical protein [Abditibacteriales bacterium]MDW8364367.1 hypothetical protein [Abditibacteriales bacterium]
MNDPTVLERIRRHLPPGWKPSSSPVVHALYSVVVGGDGQNSHIRRYNLLYRYAARLERTMELEEVFQTLESDLHFVVAAWARCHRLFVHADVVGWRGKAIVIPGRSRSGKTTLVEALVKAGATYYSDEYAVFDKRGRVHPYPKPLSIREEGSERPKLYPVESLGGCAGTQPLPVGLIAVTKYQPGVRWRPRPLSAGQALLALLDNTVLARVKPELALAMLQPAVADAVALKGKRDQAEEVVASLLKCLEV